VHCLVQVLELRVDLPQLEVRVRAAWLQRDQRLVAEDRRAVVFQLVLADLRQTQVALRALRVLLHGEPRKLAKEFITRGSAWPARIRPDMP